MAGSSSQPRSVERVASRASEGVPWGRAMLTGREMELSGRIWETEGVGEGVGEGEPPGAEGGEEGVGELLELGKFVMDSLG